MITAPANAKARSKINDVAGCFSPWKPWETGREAIGLLNLGMKIRIAAEIEKHPLLSMLGKYLPFVFVNEFS